MKKLVIIFWLIVPFIPVSHTFAQESANPSISDLVYTDFALNGYLNNVSTTTSIHGSDTAIDFAQIKPGDIVVVHGTLLVPLNPTPSILPTQSFLSPRVTTYDLTPPVTSMEKQSATTPISSVTSTISHPTKYLPTFFPSYTPPSSATPKQQTQPHP